MSALSEIKARIDSAIYENTEGAITGEALNGILNEMADALGGKYLVINNPNEERLSNYVVNAQELGDYAFIVVGVGVIFPSASSSSGWLVNYLGWYISSIDTITYDISNTFNKFLVDLKNSSSLVYGKPSTGIPESDLATALKNKLALIDRKADKMTVTSANPDDDEVTILPNEFCVMVGEPYTSFYVIYFLENTTHMESIFKFTTGDDVPTIEWDGITAWLGGEPIIKANKTYIVSVLDGLGVIGEF